MKLHQIDSASIPAVAQLMSEIKPDWWDFEGASEQLSDVNLLAKLAGWYIGDANDKPVGWILCAEYPGYSLLTIENLGFDADGHFVMEEEILPLLKCAEEYAVQKGYRNLKYIIGSTELSCHGHPLNNYAEELKNLKSHNRKHYDFFMKCGFLPAGFIPDCYGENYHGVIMIKRLTKQ